MDLARDMMPKKGQGEGEEGSSGQSRFSLSDPFLIVDWRSSAGSAACGLPSGSKTRRLPDFKVKYIVSRVSDAEAALVNLSENIQREDPKPIQLAHAVRSLTEDYGLTLKQARRTTQAVSRRGSPTCSTS